MGTPLRVTTVWVQAHPNKLAAANSNRNFMCPRQLLQFVDSQLVTHLRARFRRRSGRELQYGMRRKTSRQPPGRDRVAYFANFPSLVQIDQVDRKLHEERMHRLAGNDPQAGPVVQPFMFEQTGATLGTGIGYVDGLAQHTTTALVAHLYFQS